MKEGEVSAQLKNSGKVDVQGQKDHVKGLRKQIAWFKLFLSLTNINFCSRNRLRFQIGS